MVMRSQGQFVFYIVKLPNIKDFVIIDGLMGTCIYYAFKLVTSSAVIGFIASTVGVAGIRGLSIFRR